MSRPRLRKRLMHHARVVVSAAGRRVPFVLGAARQAVAGTRRMSYHRLERAHPVDPHVVLFKSYSGRAYACSPRAIFETLIRDPRFDDYEIFWAFREPLARALAQRGYEVRGLDAAHEPVPDIDLDLMLGPEALDDLKRAVIVVWGSPEYDRTHARAAYWYSNSVIPWHLAPRPGQVYVQTWHGTPLKRLGCDIDVSIARNALYSGKQTHRRYAWEGQRFTYLLSPSRFATERFASAFALNDEERAAKILELGYPRNDRLYGVTADQTAAIRGRLGIPAGKKAILYAPTWRDDQHNATEGYTLDLPIDFDALQRQLGDEYVVLFRTHYLIANSFDFARHSRFVIDVSGVSDINDLYIASDMLVTDYSSVLFDYANLRRPMVFFMYDLETYANDMRGFYLQLADLPGPVARTQDELVAAVRGADTPDSDLAERYQRFNERFTYLDDGQASQRVIERVMTP